jgi:hypothetical protein
MQTACYDVDRILHKNGTRRKNEYFHCTLDGYCSFSQVVTHQKVGRIIQSAVFSHPTNVICQSVRIPTRRLLSNVRESEFLELIRRIEYLLRDSRQNANSDIPIIMPAYTIIATIRHVQFKYQTASRINQYRKAIVYMETLPVLIGDIVRAYNLLMATARKTPLLLSC